MKDYDVVIPFENGKTWQEYKKRGVSYGDMVTYFRSGQVKEVMSRDKHTFIEYYPDGKVTLKFSGERVNTRNGCQNCEMTLYDSAGNQRYLIEGRCIYIDNMREDRIRVGDGSITDCLNDTVIEVGKAVSIDLMADFIKEGHY